MTKETFSPTMTEECPYQHGDCCRQDESCQFVLELEFQLNLASTLWHQDMVWNIFYVSGRKSKQLTMSIGGTKLKLWRSWHFPNWHISEIYVSCQQITIRFEVQPNTEITLKTGELESYQSTNSKLESWTTQYLTLLGDQRLVSDSQELQLQKA